MKTLSKAVAIASLVSAGALTTTVAQAEVAYNAAVVSDYVWRGTTQNDNGFAIQGGADYAHESGLSVGAWASTIMLDADDGEDTIEVDLYGAYGFNAGGLDAHVGVISYQYDESDSATEINAGVGKDAWAAMWSMDTDSNDMYLEGSYGLELPQEMGLDLHLGYRIPDDSAVDEILDLSATIGKSLEMVDISATVTYIDADFVEDDVLAYVMVSKEF